MSPIKSWPTIPFAYKLSDWIYIWVLRTSYFHDKNDHIPVLQYTMDGAFGSDFTKLVAPAVRLVTLLLKGPRVAPAASTALKMSLSEAWEVLLKDALGTLATHYNRCASSHWILAVTSANPCQRPSMRFGTFSIRRRYSAG